MAVYGFSVQSIASGVADFVVATGENVEEAHAKLNEMFEEGTVEILQLHLGEMIDEQYSGIAVLTNIRSE